MHHSEGGEDGSACIMQKVDRSACIILKEDGSTCINAKSGPAFCITLYTGGVDKFHYAAGSWVSLQKVGGGSVSLIRRLVGQLAPYKYEIVHIDKDNILE